MAIGLVQFGKAFTVRVLTETDTELDQFNFFCNSHYEQMELAQFADWVILRQFRAFVCSSRGKLRKYLHPFDLSDQRFIERRLNEAGMLLSENQFIDLVHQKVEDGTLDLDEYGPGIPTDYLV